MFSFGLLTWVKKFGSSDITFICIISINYSINMCSCYCWLVSINSDFTKIFNPDLVSLVFLGFVRYFIGWIIGHVGFRFVRFGFRDHHVIYRHVFVRTVARLVINEDFWGLLPFLGVFALKCLCSFCITEANISKTCFLGLFFDRK